MALEPEGSVARVEMELPVPPTHVAPPAPTQVQVTPVITAGTVSLIVRFVTVDGPAFDATTV